MVIPQMLYLSNATPYSRLPCVGQHLNCTPLGLLWKQKQPSHACGKRIVQQRIVQTGMVSCHSQISVCMHLLYCLNEAPGACSGCLCAEHDARRLMERGMARRRTNETRMNAESSRSHAVLTLHLESSTRTDSGLLAVRSSRLNLVDLAGMISLSLPVIAGVVMGSERWRQHQVFLTGGTSPTETHGSPSSCRCTSQNSEHCHAIDWHACILTIQPSCRHGNTFC